MARLVEGTQCGLDLIPTLLVVEAAPDELLDERASPTRPSASVELSDRLVIQMNVQTHVPYGTHDSIGCSRTLSAGLTALACATTIITAILGVLIT